MRESLKGKIADLAEKEVKCRLRRGGLGGRTVRRGGEEKHAG